MLSFLTDPVLDFGFHVPTGKQNFMDALREQYEGFKMLAYKDKTQGT